ncbi:unnamed protein product, partial [Phaeothamnion confervicola]
HVVGGHTARKGLQSAYERFSALTKTLVARYASVSSFLPCEVTPCSLVSITMGRRRRCRPINVVALAAVACAGSLGEAGVDAGGSVGLGTRQAGVSGCFVCTVSPVARPDRQLRRRRGLSSGSALRWDALSSRTRAATAFIDAEPQRTARAAAAAGSSSATRAFGTGGTQYGSRHLVCRLG